ncbi:MAG: hypothetical protein FJZ01_23520 [Candidatus Sericytochromatia bacterium]|nr:hypothetical protein [Candidatus Tanganyikabacteria bacterium]
MPAPIGADPKIRVPGASRPPKVGSAATSPPADARRRPGPTDKAEAGKAERGRRRSLEIPAPDTPTVPTGVHSSAETREARKRAEDREDRADARAERLRERRRENEKVPLGEADERFVEEFNKEERAAYRRLSPAEREKFRKVYEYAYYEKQSGEQAGGSESAQSALRSALKQGAMQRVDHNGTSVLDHFARRVGDGLAPGLKGAGLDGRQQLGNMAREIAFASATFQGAGTRDCVAASMELQLARRDPGEFMRVATGLVFDGKATLHGPDGRDSIMRLDAGALKTDVGPKVRSTTNQLIQQSFMTYARESFPAGTDDNRWVGGERGTGLTMRQAEGLYENLTGGRGAAIKVTEANSHETLAAILAAGKAGGRFQVGLGAGEGGHMVTLLGVARDRKGRLVARYSDSATGKTRKMSWNEFKERIKGAVIPSEFAGQLAGNRASTEDFGGTNTPVDAGAISLGAGAAPAPAPAPPPPAAPARPGASANYWRGRGVGGSSGRG